MDYKKMMDIIGAGFGRTGTLSLKMALESLGFGPCYHMTEVLDRPDRARAWLDAAGGSPEWERLFSGYRSTVDWPGATFWRQLAEHYPSAKVILTVRDPDRWFDSVERTIYRLYTTLHDEDDVFYQMIRALVWDGDLGGRFDRASAIARFNERVEQVTKAIEPQRLLVYRVSDGWGPLCEFLGVDVPTEDFPHANDSADFAERIAERQRVAER
jgi:Sulfotransferase domain